MLVLDIKVIPVRKKDRLIRVFQMSLVDLECKWPAKVKYWDKVWCLFLYISLYQMSECSSVIMLYLNNVYKHSESRVYMIKKMFKE